MCQLVFFVLHCQQKFILIESSRAHSTNVSDEKASVVQHNGEERNLVDLGTDVRMMPLFEFILHNAG